MSNPSNVSPPLTPLRVLIVEDETMVGVTITEQLKGLGHTVVGQAATAVEALQLFAQHAPDLVLLDVRLNAGDGIELARQLLGERGAAR
jgi:response regulator NasT